MFISPSLEDVTKSLLLSKIFPDSSFSTVVVCIVVSVVVVVKIPSD